MISLRNWPKSQHYTKIVLTCYFIHIFFYFLFSDRNVHNKVGWSWRTFRHSVGCITILSNRYHEIWNCSIFMTIVFQSRATYDSVSFNAGPGPNYSSLGGYLVLIFYWSFRHISFPIPICKWKMPFVRRRVRRFVFKFLVFFGVCFFWGGGRYI